MKIEKKELLIGLVLGFCVFGIGMGVMALIGYLNNSKEEKQAAAQAQAVSETMTAYSNQSVKNLEATLKDLNDMKFTTQDIKKDR